MPITDLLERNARLYGGETSLVEINPSEERDKATTWWDFNLIESASTDVPYRRELTWSDFDRAILGMRLTKVPERANNAASYGRAYTLDPSAREKYAIWILGEHAQSRKADLLEVMLLKDRLAILTARWELFEPHLGGTADEWKDRLIHWCTARNPALHANDYLTKQDEAKCERCCDEFLRRIGPMFPDVG